MVIVAAVSPLKLVATAYTKDLTPPRVHEVHGPETPMLAMGDFNDDPFDTSVVHTLSTR
jgi:hypothetical protein